MEDPRFAKVFRGDSVYNRETLEEYEYLYAKPCGRVAAIVVTVPAEKVWYCGYNCEYRSVQVSLERKHISSMRYSELLMVVIITLAIVMYL